MGNVNEQFSRELQIRHDTVDRLEEKIENCAFEIAEMIFTTYDEEVMDKDMIEMFTTIFREKLEEFTAEKL